MALFDLIESDVKMPTQMPDITRLPIQKLLKSFLSLSLPSFIGHRTSSFASP